MQNNTKRLFAAALICLSLFIPANNVAGSDLVIGASISLNKTTMTRDELRNIYYLLTRYWDNGEKIVIVMLPGHDPIHQQFLRSMLFTTSEKYQKILEKLSARGSNEQIIIVNSLPEMLKTVSTNRNAIGYFSEDILITYRAKNNVKIITIVD